MVGRRKIQAMIMANGGMYTSFEEGVRRLVHGLNINDPKITTQMEKVYHLARFA